jgi:hypothetical protein
MKLNDGCTRFARGLSSLQAVALILLLLGLPLASGTANATTASATASGAHVYLVRGVFNIFSLGMDEIAAKLQRQGINATVHNHMSWASIADDAAAEYRSGRAKTIVLVGHSSGATVLPDIVARMSAQGAPVKLAIGLDSVFRTSLQGTVGRYINFYVATGSGEPVARTSQLKGTLENVDVHTIPGIGHLSIDKNEIMQQKVISAIDAVVLSRPGPAQVPTEASVAPKPPVEAAPVKPAASATPKARAEAPAKPAPPKPHAQAVAAKPAPTAPKAHAEAAQAKPAQGTASAASAPAR